MESRPRPPGSVRTRRKGGNSSGDSDDPFLHSIDPKVPPRLFLDEGDVSEPIFSLLGDLGEDGDVFGWNATRTLKPRDQFHEMSVSFATIATIYRYLTNKQDSMLADCTSTSTGTPILCQSSKSRLLGTDDGAPKNDVPRNKSVLFRVYDYLAKCEFPWFSGMKQHVAKSLCDKVSSPDCLVEEDGLSASSYSMSLSIPKSRNLLRLEERIHRDLSLMQPPPEMYTTGTIEVLSSCLDNTNNLIEDTSFWMKPEKDLLYDGLELVGPEKRGGNLQKEVELTVQVKNIHLRKHPEFTAEEKTFSHVSSLYGEYQAHVDANSVHCLTTRQIELCKRIRFMYTKRNEDSKETAEKLKSTLKELQSTSSDLVTELEFLRNKTTQIKQLWGELLALKKGMAFSSYDYELKSAALDNEELNNVAERLAREISPTKRVLNQIRRNKSYQCIASLQLLDDVESSLSNTDNFPEVIEMVPSDRPTQPEIIPKEEKSRRHRIGSEKYFARLLVNGMIVGDTKVLKLGWPSFSIKINHRFICKMSNKPVDTCIQIWKASIAFLPDILICSCFINTLEDQTVKSTTKSCVQFSSNGSPNSQRHIKGTVWITSRCKIQTVKRSNPATHSAKIPGRDYNPILHQTVRLIRSSSDLTHKLKRGRMKNQYCPDRETMMAFKLPVNGILFSNKTLLEEPLRHILIKKRQRSIRTDLVPSPIPISEQLVQNTGIYQNLIRSENDELIDENILSDTIKERASVNKQHMLDIFREFKKYSRLKETRRKKLHFSEIIHDAGRLHFANEQEFQMPFPSRKRSLFPTKKVQCVAMPQTSRCSLMLTVVGGNNIPIKLHAIDDLSQQGTIIREGDTDENNLAASTMDSEEEGEDIGIKMKIKFRGKTFWTQLKDTVCIPLHDIIHSSLSSVSLQKEEYMDIILFDCVNLDLRHMGGYYNDEQTIMTEFRYLGHVSIPLLAVLHKGSMDSLVYCDSPDFIAGYVKESNISIGESDHVVSQHSNETMLRIHATTEPLVVFPTQSHNFPSNEPKLILSRIQQWSRQHPSFSFNNPGDHFTILWPDSGGKSHLISRFITEQAPPLGFSSPSRCAHYVSLIPSLEDGTNWKAFEGRDKHMVLKSQQFLNIMTGNRKEHAILLANFFLYLSKETTADFGADVFLAVGLDVDKTVFVVRRCRKTREVVFWDATRGRAYRQSDGLCPLQKVCYLASAENIFKNIESEKTSFLLDEKNPKKWSPLLKGQEPLTKVQDSTLYFTPADNHFARQLSDEISESIQNAIRGWRRVATSFRADASTKIFPTIDKLEQGRMASDAAQVSLPESITKSRSVFGFTLHFPFTSILNVLERVKATEIHLSRNPHVEYLVTVRAYAYPGGVISLWVLVFQLVPKPS